MAQGTEAAGPGGYTGTKDAGRLTFCRNATQPLYTCKRRLEFDQPLRMPIFRHEIEGAIPK